jgi:hypothetical protein
LKKEHTNEAKRAEPSVIEATQGIVSRRSWDNNHVRISSHCCIGTTEEELQLGSTGTVTNANGSSELDTVRMGESELRC